MERRRSSCSDEKLYSAPYRELDHVPPSMLIIECTAAFCIVQGPSTFARAHTNPNDPPLPSLKYVGSFPVYPSPSSSDAGPRSVLSVRDPAVAEMAAEVVVAAGVRVATAGDDGATESDAVTSTLRARARTGVVVLQIMIGVSTAISVR